MSTAPLRRDLLSVADLGRDGIVEVLRLADSCAAIGERAIPKVPILRGKTVATAFFEPSTRTRLSFETAAKRLSADTMTFTSSSSSMEKGESLRDTAETIAAMGVDLIIVRHRAAGAPQLIASWVDPIVVNAGDGAHEHPTQALTDCYTIRAARAAGQPPTDDLRGVRIAIVGDVRHSRVARSNVIAFTALGAEVVLVGPATLLPCSLQGWPVEVSNDLDAVIGDVDVVYVLRLQSERMTEALLPSLADYRRRFGLTVERASGLRKEALILHPGPMNKGVEIDAEVAELSSSAITRQVHFGVSVRMAVLLLSLAMPNVLEANGTEVEELNALTPSVEHESVGRVG